MDFQLVDRGWESEIRRALSRDHSEVRVVCPFIQKGPVELLLERGNRVVVEAGPRTFPTVEMRHPIWDVDVDPINPRGRDLVDAFHVS